MVNAELDFGIRESEIQQTIDEARAKGKKVVSFNYRVLPVFANLLPADPAMSALIAKVRAPY